MSNPDTVLDHGQAIAEILWSNTSPVNGALARQDKADNTRPVIR